MTREEFISGWCAKHSKTREQFDHNFVALRCSCGEQGCTGWAAIGNTPSKIAQQIELYTPADCVELDLEEGLL